MKIKTILSCAITLLLLAGCAGFSAQPDIDSANGIRYYAPASYLLVYSDGKGNLQSQILVMPDLDRKMVIDLKAVGAKNNSTLTFQNGILTGSKFVVDTTALPGALIDTIKTLGTTAIASAFNAPEDTATIRKIPSPYLFKIVVDRDGTRLVGKQGVGPNNEPLIVMVRVTKEGASGDDQQNTVKGDAK
jgi:hypothetical protein